MSNRFTAKPDFELFDDKIAMEKEPLPDQVGSILLTEGAIKSRQLGLIAVVGPGTYQNGQLNPLPAKPGDIVYYSSYAGTDFEDGGITYVIGTGTYGILTKKGHINLDVIPWEDRWAEVWKIVGDPAMKTEADPLASVGEIAGGKYW